MFWHLLLMLFSPLYLMFGLVFRGEQARAAAGNTLRVIREATTDFDHDYAMYHDHARSGTLS